MHWLRRSCVGVIAILGAAVWSGCTERAPQDGRVHIQYWEKWTGSEADAMERVVEAFNASQDKIYVEYLSVSNVDRKTLLATAGGDPPDVAGLWGAQSAQYAGIGAIQPLDPFLRADGIEPQDWLQRYAPVFAELCHYQGRIWCLPSTPTVYALHWNKRRFREAGLDPERPPRTLEEFEKYCEALTTRNAKTGRLERIGWLPHQPFWMSWSVLPWFGGTYWDGTNITLNTAPQNLKAMEWLDRYFQKYGQEELMRFSSSLSEGSSSQSPFFTGQVAMEFNGVWVAGHVLDYAPGLEYGVAGWPQTPEGSKGFCVGEMDALYIPVGAKHPQEAWQFIKYVNTVRADATRFEELQGMELLCFLQRKQSAMRECSPYFMREHPNKYITVFQELALSTNAVFLPKMATWRQYSSEFIQAFDRVRLGLAKPQAVLEEAQEKVDEAWQRDLLRQRRLKERAEAAQEPAAGGN